MNNDNKSLIDAIRHILKPLVRFLIKKNVSLKNLINILKVIYVEEAQNILTEDTGKATTSQISVMTGVHRKDVKVLRDQKPQTTPLPENLSISGHIIALWIAEEQYTDDNNQPIILHYQKSEEPSFVSLVESISLDIRPRAILDELVRQKIASYNSIKKTVKLHTKAFIPQDNWEEKVYYFGQNSGDHIAAAAHNIMGKKPAFFDRSVYYNNLTKSSVETLKKISSDSAMRNLEEINKKASELYEQDKNKRNNDSRFNFGSYFFSEQEKKD